MAHYFTKKQLYRVVDNLKILLDINELDYPLYIPDICKKFSNLIIENMPFKTKGLRGMAIIAPNENEKNIILLNSDRTKEEQNFDSAHELIHVILHSGDKGKTFNCFDKVKPSQDRWKEWQANEGGAELIIPYKLLLPFIADNVHAIKSFADLIYFKCAMAKYFNVSFSVMHIRFESLRYEINQYLYGVPLDLIEILSKKQQEEKCINMKTLNSVFY